MSILRNGIDIGCNKFETLAFSNSQLKENSLWMFSSRPVLTAGRKKDTEEISFAVRSLRKEAKAWFNQAESDPATPTTEKEVYAKASAWYHVTYHHSYWGCYNEEMNRDHFLSFAWSVYDKLVDIKKGKLISGPEE